MIDLRDDGTITIDFPDPTGQVTIRPPKYGAFKRIRAERQRLGDELGDRLAALPALDKLPKAKDQSENAKAERERLTPLYRKRLTETQDLVAETMIATWRLILLGHGDDFAGLAEPAPPTDSDEWPAEIIIDTGETEIEEGVDDEGEPTRTVTRTDDVLLEQVFKHWGKARSRSGPTPLQPI